MWLQEQYVYFKTANYSDKGSYADGSINSPEKQKDGSKKYSSFFCRFVGNAYDKVRENPNIKSFKMKMAYVTRAPYINADGQNTYPKWEKVIIIDIDEITYNDDDNNGYNNNNNTQGYNSGGYIAPTQEEIDDDDIPF